MEEDIHFMYRTKILNLIADFTSGSIHDIQMHNSLAWDLGLDSLDRIELTMGIEDEFDIEILDEEAEALTTVQEVLDFVYKTVQKKIEGVNDAKRFL